MRTFLVVKKGQSNTYGKMGAQAVIEAQDKAEAEEILKAVESRDFSTETNGEICLDLNDPGIPDFNCYVGQYLSLVDVTDWTMDDWQSKYFSEEDLEEDFDPLEYLGLALFDASDMEQVERQG